jgi:hypothetical protein
VRLKETINVEHLVAKRSMKPHMPVVIHYTLEKRLKSCSQLKVRHITTTIIDDLTNCSCRTRRRVNRQSPSTPIVSKR